MGMYECNDQMVSHPQHYQGKGGMEVIDVIEAFTADLSGIEATDTGNIIKYACRWKQKNGVQDLKKIMWYTQHLINHLEGNKTDVSMNDLNNFARQLINSLSWSIYAPSDHSIEHALTSLQDILRVNGNVRISDVIDVLGSDVLKISYHNCYDKVGWYNLDGAHYDSHGGLELPRPQIL